MENCHVDNLLKKLNEERKTLIENLERVVEDSQKMKSRLSETGGVIRPIGEYIINVFVHNHKYYNYSNQNNLEIIMYWNIAMNIILCTVIVLYI